MGHDERIITFILGKEQFINYDKERTSVESYVCSRLYNQYKQKLSFVQQDTVNIGKKLMKI